MNEFAMVTVEFWYMLHYHVKVAFCYLPNFSVLRQAERGPVYLILRLS